MASAHGAPAQVQIKVKLRRRDPDGKRGATKVHALTDGRLWPDSRRLAVGPFGAVAVQLRDPVADNQQRHAAHHRRVGACRRHRRWVPAPGAARVILASKSTLQRYRRGQLPLALTVQSNKRGFGNPAGVLLSGTLSKSGEDFRPLNCRRICFGSSQ